jgi:N-acetylglucosamine-6-phosphate deacetylase
VTHERFQLTGRLVDADGITADACIVVMAGQVAYVGPRADLPERLRDAPLPLGWVPGRTLLPGLVDGHCHGGGGGDFGADAAAALRALAHHRAHGTTTTVASVVSSLPDPTRDAVRQLASLVAAGEIAGIHLEGPFLSLARCGAQNPAALRDPDVALLDEWVAASAAAGAPTAIRHMTWAPERRGGSTYAHVMAARHVLPALGHTDATAEQADAALRGALAASGRPPLVTHVFNGMAPMHHRKPGPVAAALAAAGRGEAVLEVIGDGTHLAPMTVRMLFDLVGPDRLVLVTDAMAASGLPDGDFELGGLRVRVVGGQARLADSGSLAGGTATLLDVVRWTTRVAGVPLVDAVRAATRTPARTLALDGAGELVSGGMADVVVVDDELNLVASMRHGRWLSDLTRG